MRGACTFLSLNQNCKSHWLYNLDITRIWVITSCQFKLPYNVILAKKVTKSWRRDSTSLCSRSDYDIKVGNLFWDFRFLQPCVWGFGSRGTWCYAAGLRYYGGFKQTQCLYCRVSRQPWSMPIVDGPLASWMWRHVVPSTLCQAATQQHSRPKSSHFLSLELAVVSLQLHLTHTNTPMQTCCECMGLRMKP